MNTTLPVTQHTLAVHPPGAASSALPDTAAAPAASVASADAHAVSAIRRGDRERYRELVERHADKVFAVAWCRLGDRHLAEEVTQETFIKGYCRLALLDKAERFGSWITSIARNAAINLGLRRRAELRKREQWALETITRHDHAAASDPAGASARGDEKPLGETLRETLASLPAIHRECLVLFYIEGKSVAEAAAVLDLSETAFKTRLHRARAALREKMEAQLEENLVQLRPSSVLVSAIMLALPVGKPVWSAGVALAGLAAKLSPMAALGFFLQILQVGPAVAMHYWIGKKEIENLRDREGLRAKNIVQVRNGMIVFFIVMIVMIAFMNMAMDFRRYCQVFAVIVLLMALPALRQLRLSRHRIMVANWAGASLLGIAFAGIGFFGWHFTMIFIFQGCFFLLMSVMLDGQPLRADLSPFVAAQSGTIPSADEAARAADVPGNASPTLAGTTTDQLFDFGRFLGDRLRAVDWRRGSDWVRLRLAPVTPSPCLGCIPIVWGDASTLTLHTTGRVEVHLGERDRTALLALAPESPIARESLESAVASSAARAFASFHAGRPAEAEALLGIEADSALYRVEPARTDLSRTRKWLLRTAGVLMIFGGILGFALERWDARRRAHLLTPPAPVRVMEMPSP